LTLVAAPIDFAAGDGLLKWVVRGLPYSFYQSLVALGRGRMRGEFISTGFDNLLPFERYWLIPLSVFNHLDDPDWLERYHQLGDWYRARKDLPGPMYLTAVRELFQGNKLIQGRFRALGRRVDLARIDCPLVLVAGSRDHITPPAQLWPAAEAVSSRQVLRVEIDAGHVGTFMGRGALREDWPAIAAWLIERDPLRVAALAERARA
jgi:poly(3-hydroxyalkanoate) synthetase